LRGLLVGRRVLAAAVLGQVVPHEPLAVLVAQDPALAADRLGHEQAAHPGGQTMPVGWNCTNSMSMRSAPARYASAWPSPLYSHEFEVTVYALPMPPVARTIALRREERPARRSCRQ
jgi:hypothetical protein